MLLSCCHICDMGRWQQKSPPSWICPLKRSCTWALECSPAWTTLGSPLGLNRWRCCETEPCASRGIHLDGLQPGWSTGTIYDNLVQRNSPLMWGYWCPQLPNELRYVFLYQFNVKIILRTNQLDVLSTAISQPSSLAGCKRNACSHFADAQTLVFFYVVFTNERLLCWRPFAFPATKPKGVNGCAHGAPESWLSYERNNF